MVETGLRNPELQKPGKQTGETGADAGDVVDSGSFTVVSITKAATERTEREPHGYGVSYAGELPQIAISQAIELTGFHNRPA